MSIFSYQGLKIHGIAASVSNKWVSIEAILPDDEKEQAARFTKITGTEGRYEADDKQTTADLCCEAAQRLLKEQNVHKDEVGVLIFVSQTPDYMFPSTACVLHGRLGLKKECQSFDINLGCSGFVYGLSIIMGILQASNEKKALLLCGDTITKCISKEHLDGSFNREKLLFGDAGTATLIAKAETEDAINISLGTDGNRYKAIIYPYGEGRHAKEPDTVGKDVLFDGMAIFEFATREIPDEIQKIMNADGKSSEDYDALVLHQANYLAMKQIANKAGFSKNQLLLSLPKFGNTSSASIPITLVNAYGNNEKEEEKKLILCGFGVGLSWGTISISINTKDILPLIMTDVCFDDGFGN